MERTFPVMLCVNSFQMEHLTFNHSRIRMDFKRSKKMRYPLIWNNIGTYVEIDAEIYAQ